MAVRFALISTSDKTGLKSLTEQFNKFNIKLLASGGTAKVLREYGMSVSEVSAVTKAPEILGGRVKTLHPVVHGGLLARDIESDYRDLAEHQISKIDFCVCNLYPFQQTVSREDVTLDNAIENIDIGGVALIRAAAKNNDRVTILTSPTQYANFITELNANNGSISWETRMTLALTAFELTSEYDRAISSYLRSLYPSSNWKASPAESAPRYIKLRYGLNPYQHPASAFKIMGNIPFTVLCGDPGYINMLDSLNAWALVKELSRAVGVPAAASFKHVSPAGVGIGKVLSETEKKVYMVDDIPGINSSPLACAYSRARGADRVSSFGDVIGLSHEVDALTAKIISREVSDGVIAPSYSEEALSILKRKKNGKYLILQMNADYEPEDDMENRQVFGINMCQLRNKTKITPSETFSQVKTLQNCYQNGLDNNILQDLTIAAIALKYTQSNSVIFAKNGQTIGIGAGQQSRIHVTRLAGNKADVWWMRFHEKSISLKFNKEAKRADKTNAIDLLTSNNVPDVMDKSSGGEWARKNFEQIFATPQDVPEPFTLEERKEWLKKLDNVCVVSDAFFPFPDSIIRASQSGTKYISAPLGSVNDSLVLDAATNLKICFTELPFRLFTH